MNEQTTKNHEHKFVIPVEWKPIQKHSMGGYVDTETVVVTKLRCECGEEIQR